MGNQIYRFRAELAYQPKIWRTIEIQGKKTLADLDHELRHAFNHDTYDHLGGFWKLIPRGGKENSLQLKQRARKKQNYREIDLGDVNPMGGGDGAKSKIAGLRVLHSVPEGGQTNRGKMDLSGLQHRTCR